MNGQLIRPYLRTVVSGLLSCSGANAVAIAGRGLGDWVTVLCYHRVLNPVPVSGSSVGRAPHARTEPGMVTSTPLFERQMELIARRFRPVSLTDVVRWVDRQSGLPARAMLVTFDDGWSDTYINAYPVMKRLGIPGVVFLATGYVGTSERHWTDRVYESLLQSVGPDRASLGLQRLKRTPSAEREAAIRETLNQVQGDTSCHAELDSASQGENVTWPQVEEMAANGFEFGSHTHNHTILAHELGPPVLKELYASADEIQSRLRARPTALAYPDGQYTEATCRMAALARYQCAFTCDEGVCTRRSNRYALPRLTIHDGISTSPGGSFSPGVFLGYISGATGWRHRRRIQ